MRLRVVPLELVEANLLVRLWHRHHGPRWRHRFSLGAIDEDGVLHGAVIVGRPVSQHSGSPREVLEVSRLVSDGTPNVCSALYAAAARAGAAMGYARIQTFVLEDEPGTSLRGAGWRFDGWSPGHPWSHPSRPDRSTVSLGRKGRWVRELNPPPPRIILPHSATESLGLWEADVVHLQR